MLFNLHKLFYYLLELIENMIESSKIFFNWPNGLWKDNNW